MKIHEEALQSSLDQEILLQRITYRIRQSIELSDILATTVAEVRSFLETDRVMVYRFHADNSGRVIAESTQAQRLPSLLGLNFPAEDIPQAKRDGFLSTRQRSIVDVATQRIGFSDLDCPVTGKLPALTEIQYRPADPCHIAYLTAMGVQSSLVVPILNRDLQTPDAPLQLWGLLVSHHSESRPIVAADLEVVQQVVDQMSIAIAQATLLEQTRAQAQREATINRITGLLHVLPDCQLHAALEATVAVFNGSGGRLYMTSLIQGDSSQVYTCGQQPIVPDAAEDWLEQQSDWQHCLMPDAQSSTPSVVADQRHAYAIPDLYAATHLTPLFPAFRPTQIRSVLIVPLRYCQQTLGCLTIFRDQVDVETLWAGRVDRSALGLQQPRLSFAAWREVKHKQPIAWSRDELDLASMLGHHFAMAIQQYQLYQQVQSLNVNLEQQVQTRTAELQQSWKVDRVLKQVTNQIRRTLDLQTILKTIAREVLKLLDTDRVVIYQFTYFWQGEVVVEAVSGNWLSLLGKIYKDECFPQTHAQLYQKGRIRAVNDVANSDLAPCHIQFLLDLQVQANLVVPIRIGTDLWGLLVGHECKAPRVWQGLEIDLVQQLADQAAIAIQQAELYAQSRKAAETATAQAQQLEQTLHELQQTQTQLIQAEKMSSLGQLVAGVAHEINNPVNFIYGNITCANEYMHHLLQLGQLCQKYGAQLPAELQQLVADMDLEFLVEDLPKLLSSMKLGADRIRQIVVSLRNFSRLDEAEMKPVDIHEGIDSALLILQHRLKAKPDAPEIQVIKDYGQLPLVECYAGQLNQVFLNILSNAIDAVEGDHPLDLPASAQSTPGIITIRTAVKQPDLITIQIADNGSGITEAVRKRLFDPFFTTKPVGKGTGIGLSISYQIVTEKHKGALWCTSEPGAGSEFWIEIPVLQTATSVVSPPILLPSMRSA
ncbi:GAF domain-containing protein [Pantanalinema sp. GBBB05]|uniref:GAF domain-containing protein n=1 Tax=Pantanalinema sp. GBBB05 TaxID=2604139 RepID=UPI001D720851|nr:GAF domain-containing protein [Pantanalinema sp. GBBB05]